MLTQRPRGTADILPPQVDLWQHIEQTAREWYRRYGYVEVRTPIFEHTELFLRGVGDTTDIVSKEMYTFEDRGGRSLTLRPEGTAGVVRAFVENKLYGSPDLPAKLCYTGPMFRYERPQAGRMRQLHQCGVEVLGADHPGVDAEVLALATDLLAALGIPDFILELGSVGCPACRARHREALIAALSDVRRELCEDCQSRFERNPMRILDCKNDTCRRLTQNAPTMLDHLCEDCSTHFKEVKRYLEQLGIAYQVNPRLVRGLDYYTRTAFEIVEPGIGANSTILAGGRYNGLVAQLGGPDTPGIGFAFGMERVALSVEKSGGFNPDPGGTLDVFVATMGEAADLRGAQLLQALRAHGLRADKDYVSRGLRAQLKSADRRNARSLIILGDDEVAQGIARVKNLATQVQDDIPLDQVANHIKMRMSQGGE